MSVAAAIRTRDVGELPSRRDEDWRWTDLRGLIRVLPDASKAFTGTLSPGPFDRLAADHHVLVKARASGHQALHLSVRAPHHAAMGTQRVGNFTKEQEKTKQFPCPNSHFCLNTIFSLFPDAKILENFRTIQQKQGSCHMPGFTLGWSTKC